MEYTDFALQAKDGELFPCHKFVLDRSSPFFKALLSKDCEETKNGVMKVPDHDAKTVEAFRDYLYADKAGNDIVERLKKLQKMEIKLVPTGEHIFKRQFDHQKYTPDLLTMAHMYQIEDLQTDCIEHLQCNMNKENAVGSWIASEKYDCVKLKTAALEFLIDHLKKADTADIQGFDETYHSPELMKQLLNYTFANHMITKPFKPIGPLANPFGQRPTIRPEDRVTVIIDNAISLGTFEVSLDDDVSQLKPRVATRLKLSPGVEFRLLQYNPTPPHNWQVNYIYSLH